MDAFQNYAKYEKLLKLKKEAIKAANSETSKKFKAINFSYLGSAMEKIVKTLTLESIPSFLIAVKNIFEGLKELNKNGVYHNDIKPSNIVLDKDKFKLIDFGAAFFKTDKSILKIHSNAPPELSEFGFTPGYISPEFYYHKLRMPWNYEFKNAEITVKDNKVVFDLQLYEYDEVNKKVKIIKYFLQ